ncbi:molecular chaperone DnaJ [Bifidobacterium bohemicum]|uniref:Chaperone protein DnaJ n=1 Tax=Bifidobacterium bohemicum DSM 22767 TaxID=1437606 RepID=A0A086ZJ50_9BIFI|nr:molecular chaperone DnaJ [Bifidobacterium bohemicum]KFI46550.1 Chaperone protein dnaJ [Bifidobacterium bohemicum DSM 22767]SCB74838.1 molecular chaperone DnaJ [Bifidobacterium bohemicum]
MADYYEVLGVGRQASDDEIKKAYRRMSRKYHPDIAGPEFEDKFKEVNSAYEVLSDPNKRRMYDSGIDPNDPNSGYSGAGGFSSDMGDIFSQFFGNAFGGGFQEPESRTQPGRDSLSVASIDLKTAVFGGIAHVSIDTFGLCQKCGGVGSENGEQPVTCPDCNGKGVRQKVVRTMLGQMMTTDTCERCDGHGTIIEHPCAVCDGHGRVRTKRDVGVTIPAGIKDNTRLRLVHQGDVGEGGGSAGDLYVDVRIEANSQFTRDGDDLHCWIQIPMSWAVLGHELDIDTFDGKQKLVVPAGCQPDQTVTLKGLGVTKLKQEERGSLIVHVSVVIPTKLDDKERELISQFAKRHDSKEHAINQSAKPSVVRKSFFSKLKDALS